MGLKRKQVAVLPQGSPGSALLPRELPFPWCLSWIPHTCVCIPESLLQPLLAGQPCFWGGAGCFSSQHSCCASEQGFHLKPAPPHSLTPMRLKRLPCILEERVAHGFAWKTYFSIPLFCVCVSAVAALSRGLLELGEEIHGRAPGLYTMGHFKGSTLSQITPVFTGTKKGTSHIHARSWVSYLQLFPP